MLLRSGPVPTRFRSARDALDLIETALDAQTTTLVIVERATARGLVVNLAGPVPPDHLERLHGLVLSALEGEPGCRIVLATRTGTPTPGSAEIGTWRRLQTKHAGRDAVLLDWFLTDGERAVSVAAAAGDTPTWAPTGNGRAPDVPS
jgi:hypothetical protein